MERLWHSIVFSVGKISSGSRRGIIQNDHALIDEVEIFLSREDLKPEQVKIVEVVLKGTHQITVFWCNKI